MDVSLLSLVFKPKKYIFRINDRNIIVENKLCDNDENFELVISKINGKVKQFNKNSNMYFFTFTNLFQEKLFQIYLKHFNLKFENFMEILDKSILNILSDEEFILDLPSIDYEIKKPEDETKYRYDKKLWRHNNYGFKSYQRNILQNGNHEIILNMNWDFNLEIIDVNDNNFLITLENRGCNYYNLYGYEKNSPTEKYIKGEKVLMFRKQIKNINDGENISVKLEVNKFPMYIVNEYIKKTILEITEDKIKLLIYDRNSIIHESILEDLKNYFSYVKNMFSLKRKTFSPIFIPEKMEFNFCNKILKIEENDYYFLTFDKKIYVFFENKNIIPIYFNECIAMLNGNNEKYILWEVDNNNIFSPTSF